MRNIITHKNHFEKFYREQDSKTQEKIENVLDLVRWEHQIPFKFFKHIIHSDGIYEIRVRTAFRNIRILCFFDNENLLVLCNTFTKKTQKTPQKEIRLAERLRKEYFDGKNPH